MADKPIIRINIDSEEFDAFQARFKEYQAELANQPEQWKATNGKIGEARNAFDEAAASFFSLTRKAQDPNFAGAFTKAAKNSTAAEKSWKNIAGSIEKATKGMTGLARMSLNLAAFGGLFGSGMALAGAVFGTTVEAGSHLASLNKNARTLGLKPGEEQVFNDVYGRAGGDTALLSKMAAAKTDPTQWRYLQAAGISVDDIKNKDASKLAAEFLEKGGAAFKAHGENGGMWAQAMGLTNFADVNSLRLAGSYNHEDYEKMGKQYDTELPKVAVDQKLADASTQFISDLKLIGDELKNNFFAALVPLEPMFKDLAKEVGDAFTAYAKSGELKEDIDTVIEAFHKLGEGIRWINSMMPSFTLDPKKMAPEDRWAYEHGKTLWENGKKSFAEIKKTLGFGGGEGPNVPKEDMKENGQFKPVQNRNFYLQALEHQQGLPEGFLDSMEDIESKRGKSNVGPMTKYGQAKGPFQFLEGTAKQYGVTDRFDEKQSAAGASLYMKYLKGHYQGDMEKATAAYNWGEGNLDKSLANKDHTGDWKQYLPKQTSDYLKKMAEHGVNLNGGAAKLDTMKKNGEDGFHPIMKVEKEDAENAPNGGADVSDKSFISNALMRLSQSIDGLQKTFADMGVGHSNTFNAGPGTPRPPSQPGNHPHINVTVTTPAGSSTNVTTGGISQ